MDRKPLTRESLVEAAFAVLDEVGFDRLSVRRIADRLGVQSPALYWHIASKQELIDAMAGRLAGELGPPRDGESWQDWLTRRAGSYRDAIRRHRDGALLVSHARAAPPQALASFDAELRALVELGFPAALALSAIATTAHYTTGFALREQTAVDAGTSAPSATRQAESLGRESILAGLVEKDVSDRAESAFEAGLRLIIAGIESELR